MADQEKDEMVDIQDDVDPVADDGDVEEDAVSEQQNGAIKKKKNKQRKKKKTKEQEVPITDDSMEIPGDGKIQNISAKIADLRKTMELLTLQQGAPKTPDEALRKTYQFWDTQPVPKLDEKVVTNEPIEPDKEESEIRGDPYALPEGFHWETLDISDPLLLQELYTLLNENYVEDDDNMFRFDYSPDFLRWALQPPGWKQDWHAGMRVTKSGKLVGFISAIPARLCIYGHLTAPPGEIVEGKQENMRREQDMVEINFLCVHKKLRAKRMATVLIREITRRVHKYGIFQAVYTAGVVIPKPVASCRYWHRSLNPRKLIEVKFSHLSRNMTMQRTLKLYKLPETTKVEGFRAMTTADIPQALILFNEYMKKFDIMPIFNEEDFVHWFTTKPNIVSSFVVEKNGKITDFVSFYTLPSSVMHHPVHKSLKAAYSFYNVSTATAWPDLMGDALIVAKNAGFDVFNALDLMDNKEFLEKLKFGIGDGNLQYYLYNWKCPSMPPHKVGLVLQ